MRELFTKENITLVISVLGACAWLPVLYEKLQKPRIECKILSYDWLEKSKYHYKIPFEDELQKEINGNLFVVYMRLVSRNSDFAISRFKVKIKFLSMQHEIEANVAYSANFTLNNLNATVYSDMDKNILFCPVLRKNEVNDLETHFIVESNKIDVEYMKFIFINVKGKEQVVTVQKDDFKYAFRTFSQRLIN